MKTGIPILISCPSGLRLHWKGEFKKYTGLEAVVIDKKNRDMKELLKKHRWNPFFIVSHDIFQKVTGLTGRDEFTLIVDEAHVLKNDGKKSKAAQEIFDRIAENILLLTATPLVNRGSEAFNYLRVLHPNVFTKRAEFQKFFCEGETDNWGRWKETGIKNVRLFFRLLESVMIKAYKSEVLPELPPKDRFLWEFDNQDEDLARDMQKYREYCDKVHPNPTREEQQEITLQAGALYVKTGICKAKQLMPFIGGVMRMFSDEKLLIWVKHIEVLDYVSSQIPGSMKLSGDDDEETRRAVIDMIKDPTHPSRVLVLTVDSCGKGWNIAPGATIQIFVELMHTYADMYQAEDRLHRPGMNRRVLSFWTFCNGSRDKRTLDLINDKRSLVDMLLVNKQEKEEEQDPFVQEYNRKRQKVISDPGFFNQDTAFFSSFMEEEGYPSTKRVKVC